MTAIVGVETKDGRVMIGGDSAGTDPHNLGSIQIVAPKVWADGEWVFGCCGSFRVLQLLRHRLVIPQAPDGDDEELDEFLVTDFVDAVRVAFDGVVRNKHEVEEIADSDFLFGIHGRLYRCEVDFGLTRSALGYQATGCGMDLSLGALYATSKLAPRARVQRALEAAALHNAGVAAPFVIVEV